MSRLSKEQVEQYLTIIGENSYPAEAAELRWHIEALKSELYSQWERGYGDGITGMGAVLAGAPLENLPEANREQARRWIDRHDAELKAQTAAMLEKAADIRIDNEDGTTSRPASIFRDRIRALIPADYAAALNAMMVAAVDRGFQAGIRDMQQAVEAEREQCALCAEQYPEAESYVCQDIAASIRYRSAASPVSQQAGAPEDLTKGDNKK